MASNDPTESETMQDRADSPSENGEEQPREDAAETGASGDGTASSPRQAEHQMPDPSSLVAMAAMHIPTTDLIHVLVSVFDAHAWRSMGFVADHTGEVHKDLPAAQLSIDCLAFLLGKIEGSLEEAERRDVQRRLMDLRMNYVSKMREG
jgi:hypothetical protein